MRSAQRVGADRRARRLGVLIMLCALAPWPAAAHKQVSAERAILQIRPDAIEVLYEITFSPDEAAHWRLLADTNHNARLSEDEYRALAESLGARLRKQLTLKLDDQTLPVEVEDAKVSSTEGARPYAGKLQALVLLRATDLSPGLRKLTVDVSPMTESTSPVVVRIEADRCEVKEITGAPVVKMEGDRRGVQLRGGWPATILVEFPRSDAGSK